MPYVRSPAPSWNSLFTKGLLQQYPPYMKLNIQNDPRFCCSRFLQMISSWIFIEMITDFGTNIISYWASLISPLNTLISTYQYFRVYGEKPLWVIQNLVSFWFLDINLLNNNQNVIMAEWNSFWGIGMIPSGEKDCLCLPEFTSKKRQRPGSSRWKYEWDKLKVHYAGTPRYGCSHVI